MIMELDRSQMRGLTECQVKLAEALVENAQDRTHIRIFLRRNADTAGPSFYVDLSKP